VESDFKKARLFSGPRATHKANAAGCPSKAFYQTVLPVANSQIPVNCAGKAAVLSTGYFV